MKHFNQLKNGQMGSVINQDNYNPETNTVTHKGKKYTFDENYDSIDIDQFINDNNIDLNTITLYKYDSYNGQEICNENVCHYGIMEHNGQLYDFDITLQYIVYKMIPTTIQ